MHPDQQWTEEDASHYAIEHAVRTILKEIGEDPKREGLKETPQRVARAYAEMFSGYKKDPITLLKTFDGEGYDELVLSKDVPFFSTCEHHLLPFSGVAHVAYIASGKIVGLSKLARLVDVFAHRLQVQERLTMQVTESLMKALNPKGAACIIEASHTCQSCRGIKKSGSTMVTSSLAGVFKDEPDARAELLALIRS